MLKVTGLKLPLGFREGDLRRAAAKKLRLPEGALVQVTLSKKSVDARKKSDVHFVCAAEVKIDGDEGRLLARRRDPSVQKSQPYHYEMPRCGTLSQRPVVIGFGPAGMFAALLLAQCGQRPIVLERGRPVEDRERSVRRFWEERVLDPQSNVQFGEGGAGTFSDGKLTTGTGDGRIRKVLEELVKAGAPEEILFEAKPHIGTDKLPQVVRTIREQVLALGGEMRFSTQAVGFQLRDGHLTGVRIRTPQGEEVLECSQAILAVGHSARDTFRELHRLGLPLEAKAFSVGARIEHPASLIDRAQYGEFAGHPALGASDYKLSCHLENGRGVYTFCMCPGGYVTGAASEEGGVVTNGMSPWARDGENSNAALLVGVTPEDYGDASPLAGIDFQRRIEQAAYQLAGGDYSAPAQRVADLLAGVPSKAFGGVKPTYQPGVIPSDLSRCLPDFVVDSMKAALPLLGRRLQGFDWGDALLTAPETRSSSPVRVLRDEECQSPLARGLYPCGEGAGYAGGIVSAAVDGLRCAEALLRQGQL
ncbi:MAG: NAD(P)/FAD-dependent oxidoreductase [Acutalibacter sp.]|jgi:uncharacterized FAD-dependent dehydrogenase